MKILFNPAVAGGDGGGGVDVAPAYRGPTSKSWMSKLPSLEPTEEPPKKEPAKEPEKEKGKEDEREDGAGAGSDQDGAGVDAGLESGGTPKPKPDAAKAAGAKTEPKAKEGTAAAATTESEGGESYDIEKEAQPRTGDDWKKYKAKYSSRLKSLEGQAAEKETARAELEAKLQELEAKLSTAPAVDPELQSRWERTEALNKELSSRIAELDVQKDPRFESHYGERVNAAHADIKSILGDEVGKQFIDLLALPDGAYKKAQMADIYAALDDIQKSEIGGVTTALRAIERERAADIKAAMETAGKLKEERKGRAEALTKQFKDEFDKQLKALQDPKNGFTVFQKRQGDDADTKKWNASVEQRINTVKSFLTGNDSSPQVLVKAAMDAASADVYRAAFVSERKKWQAEKERLEAQVKELTAALPGGGRGDGGEKERTENPVYKTGLNPAQRTKNFTKMMVDEMNKKVEV